jgi:hypothetical protein
MSDCTYDIGQKPIVTMEDVKSLSPSEIADLAKTLYNKQADWYKDRITRWSTLTPDQKKQAVDDYKLLCKSWPTIELYDRLTSTNQPISPELRIDIYRFIEQNLGGK